MQPTPTASDDSGRLLRDHRRRAGLSQEELARASGVSARGIRNIETRSRRPRATTLRLLAEALRLSPAETVTLLESAAAVESPAVPPPAIVPRQLPAPPRGFAAREAELDRLDAALAGTDERLWLVTGSGGLGKTWLAVQWANAHRDEFDDGQLYLNLRGFDPEAEPTSAHAALRSLVSALGVPVDSAPGGLDDLSALYRSVTAERRLLILLDNAHDAAQVAPLLPGGTDCVTIVTSRDSLRELTTGHGARPSRLETLPSAAARRVLGSHVAVERLEAEPEAVARLVAVSAGLPLALGIIGSLAAQYPKRPLRDLAAELHPADDRDDPDGELTARLRTVLDGSRRWLDDRTARLFDLLGLAPTTGCDRYAAASLAGVPVSDVRPLLRRLEDACLIDQDAPGHYRMHDLTHGYARERALADIDDADRRAALRRLVDHYAVTARLAGHSLQPGTEPITDLPVTPHLVTTPIRDRATSLEWRHRAAPNLLSCQELAIQHGWFRSAWWIAEGMSIFSDEQLLDHDFLIRIWENARIAADQLGDRERLRALRLLGRARADADPDADVAIELTEAALRLAVAFDDRAEMANTRYQLSYILGGRGRNAESLAYAVATLATLTRTDHPRRLANCHNRLSWELTEAGRFDEAEHHGGLALSIARDNDLEFMSAMVLNSLGFAAFRAGRLDEAVEHYREAHEIYTRVEANRYTDFNLDYLGDALAARGDAAEAAEVWRDAADRAEAAYRFTDAERIRAKIPA